LERSGGATKTRTRRRGRSAARPRGDGYGDGDGIALFSGRHLLSSEHASLPPLPSSFKVRVGFPSLLPFRLSRRRTHRAVGAGRLVVLRRQCRPRVQLRLWLGAWAWVASASAALCPCSAPAVALPGHGRVLGRQRGEERRRRRRRGFLVLGP
ncbi:Os01g0181300, partial [Oryza sativa Japonica Group]